MGEHNVCPFFCFLFELHIVKYFRMIRVQIATYTGGAQINATCIFTAIYGHWEPERTHETHLSRWHRGIQGLLCYFITCLMHKTVQIGPRCSLQNRHPSSPPQQNNINIIIRLAMFRTHNRSNSYVAESYVHRSYIAVTRAVISRLSPSQGHRHPRSAVPPKTNITKGIRSMIWQSQNRKRNSA